MHEPAQTVAVLGLARLGQCRLGFAPNDTRPEHGVSANGPRYAWAVDFTVVPYEEEEDVAGFLSLEIEQNASFTHTLLYQQRNGTPVDLTGCVAKMQIRAAHDSSSTLLCTIASYPGSEGGKPWFEGITITGEDGKIEINLTPADTVQLAAGSYFYDLLVTFPSTEVRRVIEGSLEVDPGVTA